MLFSCSEARSLMEKLTQYKHSKSVTHRGNNSVENYDLHQNNKTLARRPVHYQLEKSNQIMVYHKELFPKVRASKSNPTLVFFFASKDEGKLASLWVGIEKECVLG